MSETWDVHGVTVEVVSEVNSTAYDALVVILTEGVPPPAALEEFIQAAREVDASIGTAQSATVLPCPRASGCRVVLSPTGPLTAYDDVRSIGEAARAGVRRAAAAGALRPVLALQPHPRWLNAELVALLGALEALYVPLQVREEFPEKAHKIVRLGVYGEGVRAPVRRLVAEAAALERARGVARDIGGADPERMTPAAVADYVRALFAGTSVAVRVLDDAAAIRRDYPLFAAVDRAASIVPRHRGCIIFLEYIPISYERTVMLVGKGVTYDTGGADLKTGGAMVSMSRDNNGSATVAGFLHACDQLRPNVKVVAALPMVRNSIGEECYVADEVIRSRTGLAVRIGNTDAEGRLIMADVLAEMVERAPSERNPHLYTIATLTGHASRTYGPYTAVLDNHVADERDHARALQAAGAKLADMLEVSTVRREDLAHHRGRAEGDDLIQAGPALAGAAARGHQAPTAFMLLVSGLERGALPYTHLDVAGSAGSMPGPITAATLLSLASYYELVCTDDLC